jgi:branched-chain amino acid transport system permease protein
MAFSFDLLLEAIIFGILLGCFYAAVSIGLSVAFGLLDVPHVAHPAMLILGSYGVYLLGQYGIDPILAGLMLTPFFFLFGAALYRMYYETFEKRGNSAAVSGLAFFFGIAFIIEVLLVVAFGVDQRSAEATYIGGSLKIDDLRIGCWWPLVSHSSSPLRSQRIFQGPLPAARLRRWVKMRLPYV